MSDKRDEIMDSVIRMLLPLVSPYDLSDNAMWLHYNNNVLFNRVCQHVFHTIVDNPTTLEKVLNDMRIMHELNLCKF
jgi:hypothetical protein